MRAALLVTMAAATSLVAAPAVASAQAEAEAETHSGCRAAGEFTASLARESGRAFGEFSSELAQLGLRDDFAAELRAALCEPPS
jgi:hypothetical protein